MNSPEPTSAEAPAPDPLLPPRVQWGILAAILLGGLLFRLFGITYGLPLNFAPDEAEKVAVIAGFHEGRFAHPAHQPSFLFNTVFLFQYLMLPFKGAILGLIDAPAATPPELLEAAWAIYAGRLWMVLLSTATIAAVFALGRRLAGPVAGLAGAFFYAFWKLPAAASHYLKEDTPLALFATLALLGALGVLERGRWRDYLLAGLLCGVAFGSKYPGGLMLLAVLAAHLTRCFGRSEAGEGPPPQRTLWLRFAGVFPMFLLGFFITSPTVLLRIGELASGLYWQSMYMKGGHHDGIRVEALPELFLFYLREGLLPQIGAVGTIVGVAGLGLLVQKGGRRAWLVVGWAVGYYLVAEALPSKPYPFFVRYVLPCLPVLAVGAGAIVAALLRSGWRAPWQGNAIVGGLAAITLLQAVFFAKDVLPDTRQRAAAWLDQREGVLLVQHFFYLQYEPWSRGAGAGPWQVLPLDAASLEAGLAAGQPVYAALNDFNAGRYLRHPEDVPDQTALIRQVMEEGELVESFKSPNAAAGFHNPWVSIYRLDRE